MARKITDERVELEFRGETFEVSQTAYKSMRVQKYLSLSGDPERQKEAYWAIDAICCGKSDEYASRIPEEDGAVGEFGCSNEAFSAFMAAAGEALAKNSAGRPSPRS